MYSPQNKSVYSAAYSGALSGIAVNASKLTEAVSSDYASQAAVAGAFAQAVDLAWAGASANQLDVGAISSISEELFTEVSVSPPNLSSYSSPATWSVQATALCAVVAAAESYWSSQGIAPLPLSGSGGPAPGTPAYNPAWYAAAEIWWDPAGSQGGSDSNSGTTILSPLLTFAEVVRRYGSNRPIFNYGQSVTVNQLTAQPTAEDPVFFEPYVSGGGYAALLGTLTEIATSSSLTVTAQSRGAPGTRQQITQFGGIGPKSLIFDSTRNSYAWVDSVSGGVCTMSTPVATQPIGIPSPTSDLGWASSDTFIAYSLPNTNLKSWKPRGGDVVGGSACLGWTQNLSIADSSGAAAAEYAHTCDSASNVLYNCLINSRLHVAATQGRGEGAAIVNCYAAAPTALFSGASLTFGGVVNGISNAGAGEFSIFNGDVVIHGATSFYDGVVFDNVFSDATLNCYGNIQSAGAQWGSFGAILYPNVSWFVIPSGAFPSPTFTLTLTTSGSLAFGSNTTGTSYPGWADGIDITPANIDLNHGLQDPRTGARFCYLQ